MRIIRAFFFLIFAQVTPALHATVADNVLYQGSLPSGVADITTSPSEFVALIIKSFIGIAGILGVIGVTWGGIQMILSTGEDEKQKKAKYIIIYSLVGVALTGLAYTIVEIISSLKI